MSMEAGRCHVAWYDKSGGAQLHRDLEGSCWGSVWDLPWYQALLQVCRKLQGKGSDGPLHTLSWHYCKGSAANGQQSARY